jgi:hypothetical protein
MPLTPALMKLRKKKCELEARLCYTRKPYLKNKTNKNQTNKKNNQQKLSLHPRIGFFRTNVQRTIDSGQRDELFI